MRQSALSWPDARVLTGDEATVTAVIGLASGVDVLHVAAHGRHAVDNPLFSGLELADGTLFGYDVDLIPACRTWSCSRPASSDARRCAGARRRSG
ncbi:CHAT domain-containing protein [Microbacterium sp. NIBRBAC000506063]|uniref:CHAT domain-containing protein n=1 Tax=Microbacterium sp. NIBRBAC000506063 TaxID=2734618 RepID=UPI001BB57379|nr:CHAT domain-containing protein [Microbacterium sp. NIBRBAC000506063]QTV80310.1 hypothetical protein KAE78_04875 [Microbacterium sp. NIBRBAC000506063]